MFPIRMGFVDFGKRIQDAILQKKDPQEGIFTEAVKQTKLQNDMKGFMENIDKQIMNVGKLT